MITYEFDVKLPGKHGNLGGTLNVHIEPRIGENGAEEQQRAQSLVFKLATALIDLLGATPSSIDLTARRKIVDL